MAIYEILGQRYEMDDSLSEADQMKNLSLLWQHLKAEQAGPTEPTETYTPFAPVRKKIDPDSLATDPDWLRASRLIHKMNEGKEWEGTDEDLATYGKDFMGWFNYNLPMMGIHANTVRTASQDQKEAFLYLMDTYDNLTMSWEGTGRFFKGMLTDPTTYVGLGTLGIGTAASAGGKVATKAGIRELIRHGVRTGSVAAVEGAVYSATDNSIRQGVEVSSGRKEDVDLGKVGTHAALGAGLGFGLGAGADMAIRGASRALGKSAAEGVEEAAEQATKNLPAKLELPEYRETLRTEEVFQRVRFEDLNIPKLETSVPYERQIMADTVNRALSRADQLKGLNYTQIQDLSDDLRKEAMTLGQFETFSLSVLTARDGVALERKAVIEALHKAKTTEEITALTARDAELSKLFNALHSMDEALGSHAGYALRQRREGMDLKGAPTDDPEAFARFVAEKERDKKLDRAMKDGNLEEVTAILRSAEEAGVSKQGPKDPKGWEKANPWFRKVNEFAISNVFSPTTFFINIVPSAIKTVYRPALDGLMMGLSDKAVRKSVAASYSAMTGSINAAGQAAKLSYRFEQSLLLRDANRLLEGGMEIKGAVGGGIRTIPRLLNASDEFLSQIAYRSYIAGEVAAEATEKGLAQGLKGKKLDRLVETEIKKALDAAFTSQAETNAVGIVARKGEALGHKGEKLAGYLEKHKDTIQNNTGFQRGVNEEAANYTRDLLYKRPFSGEGKLSRAARNYEEFVNKYPAWKLFGQLFFRTPVRVFEEGFRMTPGVQLTAPNFLRDLKGLNGPRAQAKARGEALMSMAFTGMAFSLYAQGRITGSGKHDDRWQSQNRQNGNKPEPYTIQFADGSTWSFRNFDPLSTPLKIIVNTLEGYDRFHRNQRQDFYAQKSEDKESLALMGVAMWGIVEALRDASLVTGANTLLKLGEDLINPEKDGGEMLRFAGEKFKMLVPNTLHKTARVLDPTEDDPATYWQMMETRSLRGLTLSAYQPSSAKSYDALGNVRQVNNSSFGTIFNIFAATSEDQRNKGRSPEAIKVLNLLDDLTERTGVSWRVPHKHPLTGDLDLRKTRTNDGTETLQDRWNRYYRDMEPERFLLPILTSNLPTGTRDVKGPKVTKTQETITKLRDTAFKRLMREEAGVTDRAFKRKRREAEVKAGRWDR